MPSLFLLRRCQPSLRKAQAQLSQLPAWRLCGMSEQMRSAEQEIQALAPDVVACDLRLIDGHASRLARQMQSWPQRPRLLLLTPTADDLLLFQTLREGASAYCLDVDPASPALPEVATSQPLHSPQAPTLTQGLHALWAGRASMSPRIARECLQALGLRRSSWASASQAPALAQASGLAKGSGGHEGQLLSLVCLGLLTDEIARLWQCGVEAIEQELYAIYRRLHRTPRLALSPA